MSIPKIAYSTITGLTVYLLPIIVVLISFLTSVDQPILYKKALERTNTYSQVSQNIKSLNIQAKDLTDDPKLFGLFKTIQNIDFKIMQNITEFNIDLTTDWISGKKTDLELSPSGSANDKFNFKSAGEINNHLNYGRDNLLRLKTLLPVFFIAGAGLFILNVTLLAASDLAFWRSLSKQMRSLTQHSLVLAIIILSGTGGGLFLSSWLKDLISTIVFDNGLGLILSWSIVNVSFSLMLWLWVFCGVFFLISIFGWLMSKYSQTSSKNKIKLNSKTKTIKKVGLDTMTVESLSVRQRVKKYHQQKKFDNNFDSNINNFSIPSCETEFSYDAIALKNIQSKIRESSPNSIQSNNN